MHGGGAGTFGTLLVCKDGHTWVLHLRTRVLLGAQVSCVQAHACT